MLKFFTLFLVRLCFAQDPSDGDFSVLWSAYQTVVAEELLSDKPENLMLFGFQAVPYDFNLDGGSPVDIGLLELVNVQPWSTGEAKFSEGYVAALKGLDVTTQIDPSIQQKVDDLNAQISNEQQQLFKVFSDSRDAYSQVCPQSDIEALSCTTSPQEVDDLFGFTAQKANFQKQIDNLNVQISALEGTEVGTLSEAVSAATGTEAEGGKGLVTAGELGGGTVQDVPNFIVTPTPQQLKANFDSLMQGGITVSVDHSTTHYDFTEDKFNLAVSGKFFFVSVTSNTQVDLTHISEQDQEFKMKISFNKWARVQVDPDEWFNGAALDILVREPQVLKDDFTLFDEGDGQMKVPIFGPTGLLNSRISGLIVASDVDIEISWSQNSYDEVKKHISESASLGIGPFQFGLNGFEHDEDHVTTDDNAKSIKAKFQTDIPQVIGYQTRRIEEASLPSDVVGASTDDCVDAGMSAGLVFVIVAFSLAIVALAGVIVYQQKKMKVHMAGANPSDGVAFTQLGNEP